MNGFGAWPRVYRMLVVVVALLCLAAPALAQAPAAPVIISPTDGQVVQGQVPIKGTTDLPNFSSAEVAFSYAVDPTHTWFTMQTASLPVTGATITIWDTTTITDGDYILRLRVILQDGSDQDTAIKVQVRNYTVLPTPSPAVTVTPTAEIKIPTAIVIVPTATPTAAPVAVPPTPSALPPNPAGVTAGEIFSGFWRGALLVGALVLVFAAIVRLRR